jgi:glutathione synthase/RimK-type ligase-like ATP-grasp enzyme
VKKEIFIVCDYKSQFGSKYNAVPYRSGMNLDLLKKYLEEYNYKVIIKNFSEIVTQIDKYKSKIILYTSSEDPYFKYKEYIEDIVFHLESIGTLIIPQYRYLKANNNKVYMELIRKSYHSQQFRNLHSCVYGTFEELMATLEAQVYPCVIKTAKGAMSQGVYLANDKAELIRYAKKASMNRKPLFFLKDLLRSKKHHGYIRDSYYQNKFIIQPFIPNLTHDWKVLVFGRKYYILKRRNRKNDFRASGSGLLEFTKDIPEGILDFCEHIYSNLSVPNLSIDIGYDGKNFYMIEFQALYFGTYTLEYSKFYYTKIYESWVVRDQISILEKEYALSIVEFIDDRFAT